MAFFAHVDMWDEIALICKKHGLTLTVYIDDVTVSGDAVPERIMWDIKKAIYGRGLRYHKEKSYFGCPAEITGVILDGPLLVPPNKQFKKIKVARQELGDASDRAVALKLQNKMDGLRGQVTQIKKQNVVVSAAR